MRSPKPGMASSNHMRSASPGWSRSASAVCAVSFIWGTSWEARGGGFLTLPRTRYTGGLGSILRRSQAPDGSLTAARRIAVGSGQSLGDWGSRVQISPLRPRKSAAFLPRLLPGNWACEAPREAAKVAADDPQVLNQRTDDETSRQEG